VPSSAWPVLLAACASCCIGSGAALQQLAAHGASNPGFTGLGLIAVLMRRPVWLIGVGVMVAGYGLQAAALDIGRLAVVEPILATGLVVALLVSALRRRSWPRPADWLAMALATGGVAVFLVAAAPAGGRSVPPVQWWPPLVFGVALIGGGVLWLARRWAAPRAAMGTAAIAGVTLGVSDALVKTTLGSASSLGFGVLASFVPYLLVAVGATGFVLQQHAYRIGELRAALPAASVLEPITGTVLGLLLFSEQLSARGPGSLLALAVAALAAAVGVWRLGGAPLLDARGRIRSPRQVGELADPVPPAVPSR
jgi:drug/metabolite transporter (DMT)-like permease